MKEKSLFARWVQEQRKDKGWTQEKLASQLGFSLQRVRNIENSSPGYIPRIKTLSSIGLLFGVDVGLLQWKVGYVKETLTEHQSEVLDGLMLGDGHLEKHKCGVTPSLKITRSIVDLKYQQWLADVFSNFMTHSGMREGSYFDERTKKEYYNVKLATRTSNAFENAHKRWYPYGVKIVPSDLVLSSLTIAIWLADDGTIWDYSAHKHRNAVQGRPSFSAQLATDGFSESEVLWLSSILEDRYHHPFRVDKIDGKWRIGAGRNPTIAMLRDVDGVFPPMDRKSNIWRKNGDVWINEPDCRFCSSSNVYRNGHNNGVQKWLCKTCRRQYLEKKG